MAIDETEKAADLAADKTQAQQAVSNNTNTGMGFAFGLANRPATETVTQFDSTRPSGEPEKPTVDKADSGKQKEDKTIPQEIDLESVVQISGVVIDREYVKDSFRAIPSEKIGFRNISNNVDVRLTLYGISGVTFEPKQFQLSRGQEITVTVNFDPTQINNLPEGVSVINCAIDLDSDTTLMLPADPPPAQKLPPKPAAVEAKPKAPPQKKPEVRKQPETPLKDTKLEKVPEATFKVQTTRIDHEPKRTRVGYKTYEQSSFTQRTEKVWSDGRPTELVSEQEFTGDMKIVSDETPTGTVSLRTWVNGENGQVVNGAIPEGWVQDPYGGAYYPPDSTFVKSNFGRTALTTATQTTTERIQQLKDATTRQTLFDDAG